MAYFAALVARTGKGWHAGEADLDGVETLEDLADTMHAVAEDEEPVLLLLEQEDAWFAVVRVDGEEDPRVFVSDTSAAARSAYMDVLLPDVEGEAAVVEVADVPTPAGPGNAAAAEDAEDEHQPLPPPGAAVPGGDADLLADLGVSAEFLASMGSQVPSEALAALGERIGFADELEQVR